MPIWNPNDIFNAYNFLDFDYKERAGNDAVRIQHYFKNNSTAEIAFKPEKNQPITETVYQNKDFYSGAVSLGLRFMPGARTSVDFSVVGIRTNPGQSDLILPYLDFVYKFN